MLAITNGSGWSAFIVRLVSQFYSLVGFKAGWYAQLLNDRVS